MYQPPHHREDRLAIQHDLIRAHPLGLLITAGPGGLLANPGVILAHALATITSEKGAIRVRDWVPAHLPNSVRAALADLTEDQQRLVRQAIYEDLSHSQIASKTGLPLGTVKSRLRLAFSKLKISLVLNGAEGGRS